MLPIINAKTGTQETDHGEVPKETRPKISELGPGSCKRVVLKTHNPREVLALLQSGVGTLQPATNGVFDIHGPYCGLSSPKL